MQHTKNKNAKEKDFVPKIDKILLRFVFLAINIIPYRSFYCTTFLRFFQIFDVAFPHGCADFSTWERGFWGNLNKEKDGRMWLCSRRLNQDRKKPDAAVGLA